MDKILNVLAVIGSLLGIVGLFFVMKIWEYYDSVYKLLFLLFYVFGMCTISVVLFTLSEVVDKLNQICKMQDFMGASSYDDKNRD